MNFGLDEKRFVLTIVYFAAIAVCIFGLISAQTLRIEHMNNIAHFGFYMFPCPFLNYHLVF